MDWNWAFYLIWIPVLILFGISIYDRWRSTKLPRQFSFRPGTTLRMYGVGAGERQVYVIRSIQSQWDADGNRVYMVEMVNIEQVKV